jgi:hypothetical protein
MIIDIGSGHKPHKDADILLEYKSGGNEHRWGKNLKINRPTLIYDGPKMPFKDNSFDFSICRHVLEHVDFPTKFLGEINRISYAGYIETPSEIAELTFTPYDQHKWIIHLSGNKLFLKKKLKTNISRFGKLFDYLCDNEEKFETYFYWKRRGLFFIEYFWKEKINFQIVRSSEKTFVNLYDPKTLRNLTKLNRANHFPKISNETKKNNRSNVFNFLEKQIITPCCSEGVKYYKDYFLCRGCSRKYPIKGNLIEMYDS